MKQLLILTLLMISFSCNKKSKQEEVPNVPKKYSFIVYIVTTPSNKTALYTSRIFETSENLSEDEKYKFLDEFKNNNEVIRSNYVEERNLVSFDSYAEASIALEKLSQPRK